MSCERFLDAIAGHAAGEDLSGAAAVHIAACESCRAEVERRRVLLAEVDAELSRTLAITASPEFVAHVTAQAAAADAARWSAWRPAAAWAGLAAAAAVVAIALLRAPAPTVSPGESPVAGLSPAPTRALGESGAPPRTERQPAVRRSVPRRARHLDAAQEPPVIVGPDQIRAIARLRELVSEGRLTAKMLPPERPHEPTELAVAPLEIPEIKVPDAETFGRPPGSAVEPEPEERP